MRPKKELEVFKPSQGVGLVNLTSEIICSYVSMNTITTTDLANLISDVHQALTKIVNTENKQISEPPKSAVPIRKSITPDYLICLEDGQKFKSLKRHLRSRYDLSPEEYRAKWQLPLDYPMVAPNYAAARSQLAVKMGLGQKKLSNNK